jgi:hypothetical protein
MNWLSIQVVVGNFVYAGVCPPGWWRFTLFVVVEDSISIRSCLVERCMFPDGRLSVAGDKYVKHGIRMCGRSSSEGSSTYCFLEHGGPGGTGELLRFILLVAGCVSNHSPELLR